MGSPLFCKASPPDFPFSHNNSSNRPLPAPDFSHDPIQPVWIYHKLFTVENQYFKYGKLSKQFLKIEQKHTCTADQLIQIEIMSYFHVSNSPTKDFSNYCTFPSRITISLLASQTFKKDFCIYCIFLSLFSLRKSLTPASARHPYFSHTPFPLTNMPRPGISEISRRLTGKLIWSLIRSPSVSYNVSKYRLVSPPLTQTVLFS